MQTIFKRLKSTLGNEEGVLIVAALLLLTVLTIIGIHSTQTSMFESQIVRNFNVYKRDFYFAEGAVMEAGQIVEDETDPLVFEKFTRPWMNDKDVDMLDLDNWDSSGDANDTAIRAAIDPECELSVVKGRPAPGTSLEDPLIQYHIFGLYGRTGGEGQALIMAGYKKRI